MRGCTSRQARVHPASFGAGFTLLEVLAATLIFAMVVTVLISTSSAAVRMAGISASRLEASLLAEAELARIESTANTQGPLPEDTERTEEEFSVRVFAEPAIGDFAGGLLGGGTGDGADGPGSGVAALLAIEAPGVDQFLLRYEVHVEWLEGAQPQSLRRTTYAFDWQSARAALPDLFAPGLDVPEDDADDADPDEVDLPTLPGGRGQP